MIAAVVTIAIGVAVLLGWAFDIPGLKSVLPGFVAMKTNTAIGLVASGASLLLLAAPRRSATALRLSQACAGFTGLVGLLTLLEYLFGIDLGIDQLLFREPPGALGTLAPNRMAPATAVNFVVVGVALFVSGLRRTAVLAQALAILVGLTGLLPIMGYLYGAPSIYGIGYYTQLAVHTAVAFVVLSLGLLWFDRSRGLMRTALSETSGGWIFRRLMPFLIGAPVVLGWLQLRGERNNWFEHEIGEAVSVSALLVLFAALTWWFARRLDAMDVVRRESDEKLRTSEAELRATIYGIGDGLIATDAEGRVTRLNTVGQQLTGWSEGEALGRPLEEVFHVVNEETRAVVESPIARALRDSQVVGLANRSLLIARDGTERPIADSAAPILGAQGATTGVVMVFRDQTDERAAQVALRKRAEEWVHAERTALLGSWSYDPATGKNTWSAGMFRIFGLDERQDPPAFDTRSRLFEPRDRQKLEDATRAAIGKGEPYSLELHFRRPDGVARTIVSVCSPQLDAGGKVVRLDGIVQDITEISEAKRDLERFFDVIPDLVALASTDGYFKRLGGQWERTLGYSREELLSTPLMEFVHPDDRERTLREIAQQVGGKTTFSFENRYRTKDGRYRVLEWNSTPAEGGLLVAAARDVTERRALGSQLMHAQKMESIGRLAGGVAHDFNNMTAVILGHAELALAKLTPGEPLYADLQEIQKAGQRSANLTRQLLAFAHRQVIAPEVVDLNQSVHGMLNMLRRLIGEHIDLTWQPGAGLWLVKLDPSQVDQVLANLCLNARDAMDAGGKLTVETRNSTFDASYCAVHAECVPGDYVSLIVSDTGRGMDRETEARIFEPFFTTKSVGEGTGLGLATVYGIVTQNHGFINVYSEPGKGTTFSIHLPRCLGQLEKSRGTPEAPARGGHETVLLVEDEPALLKLGNKLLGSLGYRVLSAGSPLEALRLAEQHAGEIDLLLTDVIMPEMNGWDLANELSARHPRLKRLFMSGYTAEVIADHDVLVEHIHFVQKPFTMKSLADKVREALDSA